MATIRASARALSGLTVYAVVFRLSDGKLFDWADSTWKTIGAPPTTPAIAMTGLVTYSTTSREYAADINLSTINATMTPVDISIKVFKQLGGSPAPATDTYLGSLEAMRVIYGEPTPDQGQDCVVDVTANLTTLSGTSMHFTVELKRPDGRTMPLATIDPTATCAIVVTQDATTSGGARVAQFSLSTVDCGSVNASHRWEVEYPNPNLTSNRGFTAKATVVSGGVTYEGDCKFSS